MEQQTEHSRIKTALHKPKIIIALVVLVVVAVIVSNILRNVPPTSVTASGIIEATEVTLASKVVARVLEVTADEGDTVTRGQVLVRLQDTDFGAQVAQARSAYAAANARLSEALNGATPEQLQQVQAQVKAAESAVQGATKQTALARQNLSGVRDLSATLETAQTNYDSASEAYKRAQEALKIVRQGARQDQIRQAKAAVDQAQGVSDQAASDLKRAQTLYESGAIAASQMDGARTAANSAKSMLDQAKARLADLEAGATPAEIKQAEAAVAQAKAVMQGAERTLTIARQAHSERLPQRQQVDAAQTQHDVAQAQLDAARAKLSEMLRGTRQEEVNAAQALANQAQAALLQAETLFANTVVRAPRDAAVLTRVVEPGDLATTGSTLMVIADLKKVDLTVYVEEPVYGRLKLGQSANVTVDSYPKTIFEGRVTKIAQEAEFTPKEIQTPDQRAKLVFAVRITIPNPQEKLKPGMPADAVLKLLSAAR